MTDRPWHDHLRRKIAAADDDPGYQVCDRVVGPDGRIIGPRRIKVDCHTITAAFTTDAFDLGIALSFHGRVNYREFCGAISGHLQLWHTIVQTEDFRPPEARLRVAYRFLYRPRAPFGWSRDPETGVLTRWSGECEFRTADFAELP